MNGPDLRFEVNFEDDPLAPHPYQLLNLAGGPPVGFWRLNETAGTNADNTGSSGIDGTYTGTVTLGQTGQYFDEWGDIDGAAEFDGSSGHVALPASATWKNIHAAWTVGAWIYPTATRIADTFDYAGIVWAGVGASDQVDVPFALMYGAYGAATNKVWAGFVNSSATVAQVFDPTQISVLNQWYFYAATWDGTILRLYLDGTQVATTTPGVANTAPAANAKLLIGKQEWDVAPLATRPFLPARVKDAFVFDYVLTADEVAGIHNRYLTIKPVDDGNYIDLSALVNVRSGPVRRGRSDSVSRVEAGTGTVILDNRDGSLSEDPVVNLLANPSAEVQTTGLPFAADNATVTYATDFVRTGLRSWQLATGTSIPGYATTQRDGLVGMRPGKTYTFSAYLYVPTGVTLANVRVEIVDEIAGSQEIASTSSPAALDAYHRLEVTKTIRDDADAAYVRVRLNEASDSIRIDDVQLEEAAAATTYCDGDQTDCSWAGEAHTSLSKRKQASAPARKIGMPMRRFRYTGTWDSVDYGLLHGFVERWDWKFDSYGHNAYVIARLTDGTRVLANVSMRGFSRASERVGDRARAILAFAGIGTDDIDVNDEHIEPLALSAQTAVADDRTALSMIRELEETERGVFFVSKEGLFTYQGSLYRSIEGREDMVVTDTADSDDTARYSDISISTDVSTVVNDVKIDNIAGSDHETAYPLSQQRYFTVSAAEQSLWATDVVSDVDRSVPLPYVDGLEVRPYRDPANLWPQVLGLELGALVRVERTHQGVDVLAGQLHFVEGIEHDITPGNWISRLRTSPVPRAPVTADPWQTPIAKPIYLTNVFSGSGGSSVVIPSRLWTAGKLYLLFCSLHATGATAPVQPSISGTNTWTSIRGDTGSSSVSWRHQTFRNLATSTVTESITLSFAGQTPNNLYDVVLIEVSDGFNTTTPVQDNAASTTVSAFAGFVDVGTLTDARSIILAGVWKNANADTNWSGGVELYDRATNNNAYSVAYGYPPGVDRIDFSWAQANGFHGTGFEVQAP